MDQEYSWKTQFESELQHAESARASGNEGKARVCARRAAGAVVAEYLRRQGIKLERASTYTHLKYLIDLQDISPDLRKTAEHFLLQVTPERSLPIHADLIGEARWLAVYLLQD